MQAVSLAAVTTGSLGAYHRPGRWGFLVTSGTCEDDLSRSVRALAFATCLKCSRLSLKLACICTQFIRGLSSGMVAACKRACSALCLNP